MNTPNRGIPLVPEGALDPAAGLNDALDVIDALLQTAVISMALTAPPGTSQDGDLYIVAGEGGTATGDWAGQENNLARKVSEGDFWQFYTAGVQVSLVLNQDNLGLYRFDTGSPGGWTVAAGLSDAPSNSNLYGRRGGAWEAFELGVSVEDEQSPPTVEPQALELVFGDGLGLEVLTGGRVRVVVLQVPPPPVATSSAANVDATAANSGTYTRFTHAGPTYTFDDGEGYTVGAEYHGRYAGAGTLELLEAGGMTLNPPADGTLEIPPGGTFTVKIIAADEADVFGVTVAPP